MEEVTRWYNRVDTMQLYQLHYRLCALIAEWYGVSAGGPFKVQQGIALLVLG